MRKNVLSLLEKLKEHYKMFSISDMRVLTDDLLEKAEKKEVGMGDSPSDLLFFIGELESLVGTVYALAKEKGNQKIGVQLKGKKRISLVDNKKTYCRPGSGEYAWDEFPRVICKKGFKDPFYTLEKFTKTGSLKKWRKILDELRYYALGRDCIREARENYSVIELRKSIVEMIEASYLIVVRIWNKEMTEKKGGL